MGLGEAKIIKTPLKKHTHTKKPLLVFTGEMSVFLTESCQKDEMTQSTWRKGSLRLCEEHGDLQFLCLLPYFLTHLSVWHHDNLHPCL